MIVIDNFVKDKALLQEIEDSKEQFFNDNGNYYYWNGWWNSPANSVKKRLIEYIWGENSPHEPIALDGFEYWTGQFGEGRSSDYLNMHLDKDEKLWADKQELSSPIIGTVFYPIEMDIEGGYLEVFNDGVDNEPERIQAKFNRLIIFDAGGTHHRVTNVTKGLRSAIAVNLWNKKPTTDFKYE